MNTPIRTIETPYSCFTRIQEGAVWIMDRIDPITDAKGMIHPDTPALRQIRAVAGEMCRQATLGLLQTGNWVDGKGTKDLQFMAGVVEKRCQAGMDLLSTAIEKDSPMVLDMEDIKWLWNNFNTTRWDLRVAALSDRHPYTRYCQLGEAGTKTQCCGCSMDHNGLGVNPPCVDHG